MPRGEASVDPMLRPVRLRKRSRPLLIGLGLISTSRLLSVLQVLLLLRVSLLHLLRLLLVFLLEFLVVPLLLRVELFLLLLVFLVHLWIARVGRSGAGMRLNILSVRCRGGRNIVLWPRSRRVVAWLRCRTV